MSDATTVTVRRRKSSDLQALAEILVRVHKVDGYPVEGVAEPEAWLEPAGQIAAWTALVDTHPIGQLSLIEPHTDDDVTRVWSEQTGGQRTDIAVPVRLFVDPNHRGRGAGRVLMMTAFELAAALGKRLVFDVMLKDERAINLYEALGCQRLALVTHTHSGGRVEPAAVYVAPSPHRSEG